MAKEPSFWDSRIVLYQTSGVKCYLTDCSLGLANGSRMNEMTTPSSQYNNYGRRKDLIFLKKNEKNLNMISAMVV